MIKYPYAIALEEGGTYFVQFVDFVTGFTEGKTVDEAAANAQEVLDLFVAAHVDDGIPLPMPTPVGDLPFVVVRGIDASFVH